MNALEVSKSAIRLMYVVGFIQLIFWSLAVKGIINLVELTIGWIV